MITLGVLYPEHSQLSFDCVIIACSLQSIRPGLVHGCKAPNGVRPNPMNMVCTPYSAPAGTQTHVRTIETSRAVPSLLIGRVGHRVFSCSERSGLSRSFKECSVLSHSFFEFLATYETQKNRTFFPVLFKRMGKNVKNVPFFCKEREDCPVLL